MSNLNLAQVAAGELTIWHEMREHKGAGGNYISGEDAERDGQGNVGNKETAGREGYGPVMDEMGRTPEERRAAFDRSKAIPITGNEIFDWVEPLNMKAVRDSMTPWMEENGYFRNDYKNKDRGWNDVAITERGIMESLWHGAGPEKIQVLAALPEMIRDGIYMGTTSGKAHQQGMRRHIFATKVNVGAKSLLVGFIVLEDASGRRFYNHELTGIRNLDGRPSQGGTIGLVTEKALRTRQDSIINVIQK